ncbi:MAG: CpaF family protein [Caldisericia bacterium]
MNKKVKIGSFNLPKIELEKPKEGLTELFNFLREHIFNEYKPEEILNDLSKFGRVYVSAKSREIIKNIIDKNKEKFERVDIEFIIDAIVSEISGFGPLEKLLNDQKVTEVMVNSYDKVYIERDGRIYLSDVKFENEEQLKRIIDKIIQPLGRRVDESSPYVDARLPDGSRVNIIIPPISKTPTITIRKFRRELFNKSDFIKLNTIDERIAELLELFTKARLNILVSGGTGTGKTTFLNFLSSMINPNERIITIEDSRELQLHQPHVISLEARPPNIEGKGEVTIRDLVRNSLRMRPDRIIVGEVRGAEALDMLQAMNTGHDGSMSTIHANSPEDVISRLIGMVLMTGTKLTERAIVLMIIGAIDLVVHLYKFEDGSRKVGEIGEYIPDNSELGVKFIPIVKFVRDEKVYDKVTGKFIIDVKEEPRFYKKMKRHGLKNELFEK